MGSASDVLDYTWMLESRWQHSTFVAGAICVDSEGLLITTTLSIRPPIPGGVSVSTVSARRYHDENLVKVDWVLDDKEFGLTLLRLPKGHECTPYPLTDMSLSVNVGTHIRAFCLNSETPFSLFCGRVCCDFVDDNSFLAKLSKSLKSSAVIDEPSCESTLFPAAKEHIGSCRIPLIQVKGLGLTTMNGHCGWPVFISDTNNLLGLFFLSNGYYQYVIPLQLLERMYQRYNNT